MEFEWSDEQMAQKQRMLDFARNDLGDDLAQRDSTGIFAAEDWQRCADFGIQSLSVPGAYHNHGETDFLTAMLLMEALGEGCHDNGLTFALNAQMWTVQHPIVHFGSDQQKQKFLPGLCDGSTIGAHAMTEPETGSDAFNLKTRAEKSSDGYLLTGHKRYISLAPIADVFLVFATTDPERGKWGVTAFLVEAASDGLVRSPVREKMGLRTVPMGDLTLNACFVPTSHRLGPEGSGLSLSTSFLEYERCCILASHVGAMARQLDECIAYAKERKQFGQAIGGFQSVSNRIVDMKLRLQTSRLLLYQSAWLKQQDHKALMETSLLKLHISEAFLQSSLDAIRIHGGRGYMTEAGIERDLRDSVGGTIYAGTSDIQRNIVAGLLGL